MGEWGPTGPQISFHTYQLLRSVILGSGADGYANSGPYHGSSLLQSMKTNTMSGTNPISTRLSRWLRRAQLALPVAPALAVIGLARADNARIPFSGIGTKAT